MTTQTDIELRLRSWMADAVPSRGPEDLVDQALERIDHVGQRPGFLVRTGVAKQGIGSLGLSTTVGLVLLVVLLLAALAAAIAVGGRLFESSPAPSTLEKVAPSPAPVSRPADVPPPTRAVLASPPPSAASDGAYVPTGLGAELSLEGPIVALADGRVLIGGGEGSTPQRATIWDPSIGTVAKAGMMLKDRSGPATVLLRDGRVLVIGGEFTKPDATGISRPAPSTAEIFDPKTGTFVMTGPMREVGWGFQAVRLADGRVLIAGGMSVEGNGDTLLGSTEIFDPRTATFSSSGSMSVPRNIDSLITLPDGRVLVVEWTNPFPPPGPDSVSPDPELVWSVELYDPATGAFGPTGPLAVLPPHPEGGKWWPRAPLAAIPLPDGHVLIPGKRCREEHTIVDGHGSEGYAPTPTEIYDPQTGTFSLGMPMPHCIGSATGLPDGKVFVTGWFYSPSEVDWSGLYDPTTGKTTMTGTPPGGKVVRLIDGRVLVIGWDATGTVPTTFLLSPEHANAP